MAKPDKIVFVHTLNNFSGSPNVLSVVIKNFLEKGYSVELITSKDEGFLSNIDGLTYRYTCYRWLDNKLITALLLLISQLQVFFMVLFSRNESTIYYLNTITPVGAAWACKFTGKNLLYHVHENMKLNKSIYPLFRWTYKHCNEKSIFVSHYLKNTAINCRDGKVIYNALAQNFVDKAQYFLDHNKDEKKTILMVASLRRYKGIYEFVELSKRLSQYNFELVLSANSEQVVSFISESEIPVNLSVYDRQDDMHPFYRRAKLLMQLSHPKVWVETFGLTILEAMVYGIPAIVPHVGGPTELIEDGKNGFLVDPYNIKSIISKIEQLMEDEIKYRSFSERAYKKSKCFSVDTMSKEIERYLLN